MSTRDEIIERAARAGFCNVDGDAKAAGVLWDSGDPIYCQDGWRDDIAAALDALTIEDLLTLAGLVGPVISAPFSCVTDVVEYLDDAACRIEEFAEDDDDTALVIALDQAVRAIRAKQEREADR